MTALISALLCNPTAASTKCHPEPEHLQAARNVLKHECDGEGSAPLVQSESLQAALLTSSLDGIVFKALIRGLDCCANEHKCQGTTWALRPEGACTEGLRSRADKNCQKKLPCAAGLRVAKRSAQENPKTVLQGAGKHLKKLPHINLPNQLATRVFAGYSSLVMPSSGFPNPCCCPPCPHAHIGGWGLWVKKF